MNMGRLLQQKSHINRRIAGRGKRETSADGLWPHGFDDDVKRHPPELIDIDLEVDIDFALLEAGAAGLRVAGLEECLARDSCAIGLQMHQKASRNVQAVDPFYTNAHLARGVKASHCPNRNTAKC